MRLNRDGTGTVWRSIRRDGKDDSERAAVCRRHRLAQQQAHLPTCAAMDTAEGRETGVVASDLDRGACGGVLTAQ
jgi:hypothetical protein